MGANWGNQTGDVGDDLVSRIHKKALEAILGIVGKL